MKRLFFLACLLLASFAFAAKPTVAVLYFDYDGPNEELKVLKKGLAQMIISDLSGGTSYSVVERMRLQEIIDELKLGQSGKIDPATAAKIGKLLGAKYFVAGGYFDLFGSLRIDARVMEVETGKTIKATGANGKPDDFLDLQQKVSRELDAILTAAAQAAAAEAPKEAGKEAAAPKVKKKLDTKTALRYSKALDAIDKKDKVTAKKELEAVVQAQPDFVLASLDLAALAK